MMTSSSSELQQPPPPQPPPATAAQEVLQWLRNLPLAPEYHPTAAEFRDPISYIYKIEKEASQYGICKIVPPYPPASRKSTISNFNSSIFGSGGQGTFTTRQQQIGFCPRKPRPVQKPVWQSGEIYTFNEFETKAKAFEKAYLKHCSKKPLSALEIETLYWKATVDKPFSVEYANDMPGSSFCFRNGGDGEGSGSNNNNSVGDSEWNMRGVARAKGSLLRYMKEDIPGVTSPMVYIAMLFSWFAWHVEDHDLHSLNYLHLGAGKTWYGVPRDAAVAFEEVVRVHGYGGEINPLVTFAVLGEKTTIMSPEVFVRAGVPCCRLVQNAGEFVVTFPRAYHSGFSHGFNCGEASNIATPEWLRVAKDAAIRRASINYPPMVSHFQLLYDLALEMCTKVPTSINVKPRSSRLKDKQKGEGETFIKEQFVEIVVKNNNLLHFLAKGSYVRLLCQSSSDMSVCSDSLVGSDSRRNSPLVLLSYKNSMTSTNGAEFDSRMPQGINQVKNILSVKRKDNSLSDRNKASVLNRSNNPLNVNGVRSSTIHGDNLSEQRLFSCVKCGILCFDCVAVIQPRESTSRHLMSADCTLLSDYTGGTGVVANSLDMANGDANTSEQSYPARFLEWNVTSRLYGTPAQSADYQAHRLDDRIEGISSAQTQNNSSALGLLATTYGNSSDSEEDDVEPDISDRSGQNCSLENRDDFHDSDSPSFRQECLDGTRECTLSAPISECGVEVTIQSTEQDAEHGNRTTSIVAVSNETGKTVSSETNGFGCSPVPISCTAPTFSPIHIAEKTNSSRSSLVVEHTEKLCPLGSDEDSSRMHVFCLEHAMELEKRLRPIGGVHIFLFCHPDYPRIEAEAKLASEELGIDHLWNDLIFREVTSDDEERIHLALDGEEASPGIADWSVKLGINLFYSVNLGWSSLYSKQMPYNSIMHNAFGRSSPGSSPVKLEVHAFRQGRQKKAVAGKWCGRVWMSNQVHPFLIKQDVVGQNQEQEQEKKFCSGEVPDGEHEREAQSTLKMGTALAARRSGKKRKRTTHTCSAKKVQCMETEDAASVDLVEENSQKQCLKIYSRRKTKAVEKKVPCDSLEDHLLQQFIGNDIIKQADSTEREDAVSDDPPEDVSHTQFSRVFKRKQTLYSEGNSSQNQHEKLSRIKQAKRIGREDATSDDSLGNTIHQWGALRKMQQKFNQRGKPTEPQYTDSEDLVSDDSLKNVRNKLTWEISGGNQVSHCDTDDAVSDHSGEESNSSSRSLRSKQGKFFEREYSDDSPDETALKQHKRLLRNKKHKFLGSGYAMSDYLKNESDQVTKRRTTNSEGGGFIQSEDADSDDLLSDYTNQRLIRKSRRNRANIMEREDYGLEDLQEANTSRNPRKTSMNKKAKSIKGSLREVTLRQMKKESSFSTKQQRQLKQEAPRVRNVKSEKAWLYDSHMEEDMEDGPSTRLRSRPAKLSKFLETKPTEKQLVAKRKLKAVKAKEEAALYQCDIEGCTMSFGSRQAIALHKKNICPEEGCGKKFFSHKYLVQHRRVHLDDRPLKCPWKGCRKTFKWAWARTEHIRVHTGERPYMCAEKGCGQTFRFVSDFSRHKRKTGHSVRKGRK